MFDVLFGKMRLRDMPRATVLPTLLLDNGLEEDQRRADALMMSSIGEDLSGTRIGDACIRSGSAPTFFRCYQGCVDGAVYANNPALCGVGRRRGPILPGHAVRLFPSGAVILPAAVRLRFPVERRHKGQPAHLERGDPFPFGPVTFYSDKAFYIDPVFRFF